MLLDIDFQLLRFRKSLRFPKSFLAIFNVGIKVTQVNNVELYLTILLYKLNLRRETPSFSLRSKIGRDKIY
jgi:hypothetical protein